MPVPPRRWGSLFLLLCSLAPSGARADGYLDELIARSRELRLHERREWHRLMHYASNLARPGVHSLADARRFFLAPDGKTNPQSELEATLASFFSDVRETQDVQNPQCAFISRYSWLDRQLAFDSRRMQRQPCKRFNEWRESLNPQGVTLIFPAAYLNNPSSMYGHTLLRIDAKDQDEKTRLLAYAINYAANTDETNGVLFAINALIGVYPGMFSIMPYYLKVREYNDLENRDIWEYELNLTPEEIDRLLMHAWELGPIYFDYYFFDENCSYYLLELLEAARPDLDLTGGFRWWAIPSDTVRAVVRQEGLLKRAVYRPSNATVIRHRLGLMNLGERTLVSEMGRGRVSTQDPGYAGLPEAERARVLEVSHDYLNYLRASGRSPVNEPAALARTLLLERSRLGAGASDPPVPAPEVRPDQGHGTSRLALGGGRRDGVDFVELRARPSYHDLLDPEGGYAQGAQIEFLDVAVRDYGNGIGPRLEDLKPVNIVSISPRNEFFQPLSWKIDTGWTRRRLASGAEPLVFGVHGGPGLAWTVPDSLQGSTMIYTFIESTLQADKRLDSGFALGAGPSLGVLTDFSPRWRAEAYVRGQRFSAGDTDTAWAAGLRQRYTLAGDWALRLDLSRERQEKQSWNTVLLSLHHYF
ncbi:MAG TPA: DUF4105 domain-containing protein [Burkholderiales bacterium]|nr:DUF4105 domain-containing protein [Burkholderiales bacterium]